MPIKLIILVFLLLYTGAQAARPLTLAIDRKGAEETLTLRFPSSAKAKIFTLDNPPRLVVDIPSRTGIGKPSLPESHKGGLVQGVRSGQFDTKTVRIVFSLNSLPVIHSSQSGDTLTVTLKPVAAARNDNLTQPSEAKKPLPKKEAREKKPMIVIDAGHGGQDPGARGADGAYEKDVVLQYALSLRKALLATKRYRVALTREGDNFILLRERIAIARKAGGDLFISLHADSAPGVNARGLSIYTLSENASDAEAEALAARENKADVISGMDLSHEAEDVAGILISLAQRQTNNTSAQLADFLVAALIERDIRLLAHPHRFAGFAVLKSPDMPSVLIETGFISHPDEERALRDRKYREKLVNALVKGIDAFFKKKQEGVL